MPALRIAAVAVLGTLLACAGETVPDSSSSKSQPQDPGTEAEPPSEPATDVQPVATPASTARCGEPDGGCAEPTPPQQQQSSSTPLVLSFDDAPVTFTSAAGGAFDLVADGACHGSDWPTAATPWLALDRDESGSIDDGTELFGSAVRLANGMRAQNGFEALRELDANHDGVFDAKDPAYSRVVVWTDRNADRRSTPGELTSLADAGVRSISLADRREERCDARGNCEGERSVFTTTTGRRGAVVDVYLKTR